MVLCAARHILRSFAPRGYVVSPRQFSTLKPSDQTRFSYYLSSKACLSDGPHNLLDKLQRNAVLENPKGHNAAVVLATPDLAKQLDDQDFTSSLVKLLSASAHICNFHLLCAIVDNVAPALGEPVPMPGISVLRGELDTLLPQLWQQPDPSPEVMEKDSVAALTFKVGMSSQTLPLTRTTFLNNRASTLLASRYNLTQGNPKLEEWGEKQWQHVHVAIDRPAQSVADFSLWAPLSPVTRARKITKSFGNIVRGIDVNGKSTPASTELEDSVNRISMHRVAAEATSGPMGVWALITPEKPQASSWSTGDAPDPAAILDGQAMSRRDIESTASYLQQQHQAGSRFYQVLSGGGGWGPKKGLLSLDPQELYFALSEEEQMEKFMQSMNNKVSGFAPPGAHIQFFVPAMASPELAASSATGVSFGVPWVSDTPCKVDATKKGYLVADHFGALSSQGVYLSVLPNAEAHSHQDSKLSVPGSRVFISNGETKTRGGLARFLGGGGGLPDAGTIAMM
ncbi:hypothetical protein QQS21_004729 [Conoideocrella luteorostrata]|uniref:Uncharacterized protein n=1 Tax=Conoideocrella luteorostrata TaxID=1105319 RepID=A0AAJ0FZM5_9HYPO|nr:hypothetical protein QQS21_004729 [Conoideocrella luteorostrata]